MTINAYYAGPRTAPKKTSGGLGGAASVWVCRTAARVRPHYPELPGPGPKRDMAWVWDWVLGLGNISRILEKVTDFVNQIIKHNATKYVPGIIKYDDYKYARRFRHICLI